MSNFDWSLYDTEYDAPLQKSKAEKKEPKKETFDWGMYDTASDEKPFSGQYAHLTRQEYEELSPEKKKELQEYVPLTGFVKGALSGATLGASEKIEALKIKEHEVGAGLGEFVGAAAPISAGFKALSYPIKALDKLMKFGTVTQAAVQTGKAVTVGSGLEAGRETIKGEGLDVGKIATEGALFGVLDGLFRAVPAAYNWVKSLKPAQQSQMLVQGVIPNDLTPNQYKFYETEVVPELQKVAQKEYSSALDNAVKANNEEFQKKILDTKARHERDIYEMQQAELASQEEFEIAQRDYQNKLKQIAAEHEASLREVEKQNQIAEQSFAEQQRNFEVMKARQSAVENAIRPMELGEAQQRTISRGGEDVGVRPPAAPPPPQPLKSEIGNVISPNTVEGTAPALRGNTTTAGENLINAIRANDNVDYQIVREAYQRMEQLNAPIQSQVPGLVNYLTQARGRLMTIPELSPPQKQQLDFINSLLERTVQYNEEGMIVGFQQIGNNILEEQAKAIRYFMDFNFEHGNTRGIFTPMLQEIENAIEMSANMTGNPAAAEANRNARTLYRQWAQDYDNPYIRPIRDTTNQDFSGVFEKAKNTDNFNVYNDILNRSNAGQQVAGVVRRELVTDKLSKFIDNPRRANTLEFNETLRDLGAVVRPEEERAIRHAFSEARRTPVIRAKKVETIEPPKPTKPKEITEVEIPLFKAKKKPVPKITEVKIPQKPKVKITPEMKAASTMMRITPEKAMQMTETPTGLKKLRSDLSKTPEQKKLFEKIGKAKVKEILYEGNVQRKFTGDELFDIINKGDNYALLAEILGEDVAAELLVASKEIAGKKATVELLKKAGLKASILKTLLIFGVI